MKRRKAILAVLIFLTCLAGTLNAAPKISLVWYFWWYADPIRAASVDYEIAEFIRQNPNVEIKPVTISNEAYWDRLARDIATNTEGDIVTIDTGGGVNAYYNIREGGSFISLDKYIKGYKLPDGTSLEKDLMLMDQMKRDGRTIALPFIWFCAPNIAYRKSHLKDAGVNPDTLKTWDAFRNAAEKMTVDRNGDGTIDRYGFGHPTYAEDLSRWWHMNWLWTAGGGIFPKELPPYTPDKLIFNSPENLFAVEYLAGMTKKTSPQGDQKVFTLLPMFYEGSLSMMAIHIWTVALIEKDMKPEGSYKSDFGLMPFPAAVYKGATKPPVYVFWSNPVAISTRCKNPDAAFKFIAFLHGEEVQKKEGVTNAPTNKRVFDWYKANFPDQARFVEISQRYESRITPDIPQWNQVTHIIQESVKDSLLGLRTPKAALDWAQAEMVKVLK